MESKNKQTKTKKKENGIKEISDHQRGKGTANGKDVGKY